MSANAPQITMPSVPEFESSPHNTESMETISTRYPPSQVKAAQSVAEQIGVTLPRFFRMALDMGLAQFDTDDPENMDDEARREWVVNEWYSWRETMKREGKMISNWAYFPSRVDEKMDNAFEKGIDRVEEDAISLRREAKKIEELAEKHPDTESYDDGELVEYVDKKVEETKQYARLSTWGKDRESRFEAYEGVDQALRSRQIICDLTRQTLDDVISPNSEYDQFSPRFLLSQLPPKVESILPESVTATNLAEIINAVSSSNLTHEASDDQIVEVVEEHDDAEWPSVAATSSKDTKSSESDDETPADGENATSGTDSDESRAKSQPQDNPTDNRADSTSKRHHQRFRDMVAELERKYAEADEGDRTNAVKKQLSSYEHIMKAMNLTQDDVIDAVEQYHRRRRESSEIPLPAPQIPEQQPQTATGDD